MEYLQRVTFRMFSMPCCAYELSWIGTRLPKHCPECGVSVFKRLVENQEPGTLLLNDGKAVLTIHK